MKIALAQVNPTVGDIRGNEEIILTYTQRARESGAKLIIFPELALTGYPPRDLLELPYFIDANISALNRLKSTFTDIAGIIGFVDRNPSPSGKGLFNAAALIEDQEIASIHYKTLLPTYDVFDEDRYFEPAAGNNPVRFQDVRLAITICEDIWTDEICGPPKPYHRDPIQEMVRRRFNLIINLAASPYFIGKDSLRKELLRNLALRYKVPVLFCNQCGGNDELVFDGNSMALGQDGNIFAHGPAFEEELIMLDLSDYSGDQKDSRLEEIASVYKALVIGTRDYARKCGFKSAVVGLSGGIDSAVVACIAAEALGPSNVLGISMPTEFSSISSRMDADILARNLKIKFQEIPVQQIFESYLSEFKKLFPGSQPDVTEENIQARIRGNLLMAISNKQGHLVLSTGNKSELAMGYCTLYGDMCGGLAVISDVPKTMVYRIANEVINREDEIIPHTILAKPPSAELHPGQKDTDSLPEYEVLDPILKAYIEEGKSSQEIVGLGFEEAIVSDVINRVQRNEYKRRQAPLGLKVTSKAFGCGRRIPIAQRLHL